MLIVTMVIIMTVLRRIFGPDSLAVTNSTALAAGITSNNKQAMKYRGASTEGRRINQVEMPMIAEIVMMKSGLFNKRRGLGRSRTSGEKASTRGERFPICAQ